MSDISKSPDRGSFSREGILKRAAEKGEEPNQDYLDYLAEWDRNADAYINNPENQKHNMEYDLRTTEWILDKVRGSKEYAQNLYASMCNNEFRKNDVWPILTEQSWSASWRSAGGIIANMRQEGDYIDWYCSGIRDTGYDDDEVADQYTDEQGRKYIPESVVTDEIRSDLLKLGWLVIEDNNGTAQF